MANADGTWDVIANTPRGKLEMRLVLKTDGNSLSGEADTPMGTQPFDGGTVDGDELSWQVKVSRPMPMKLKFKATVDGDSISGTAKAGMLGTSDFSGTRV